MKLRLTLLLSLILFTLNAQNETPSIFSRHHEIRLGAIKLLAFPTLDVSYEYVKNRSIGYGATILFNFNLTDYPVEKFSVTPFFRMYFQTDEQYGAKGFFVEGFSSFYSGENEEFIHENALGNPLKQDSFFDIVVGFALGKKWINSSGFVFEGKLGVGRSLLGNANAQVIPKWGLFVGYRF